MSAVPFKNVYHLRRVAETSQRPCIICYKPTPVVLVSEDGKNDFFYACQTHLQDRGFATPVSNAAADAARKMKDELEKEIEKVKKDWEEHLKDKKKAREKREKQRKEEKDSDKTKDENDAKSTDRREKQDHKEQMAKLEEKKEDATKRAEAEQRIFVLNKDIYSMRLNTYRNIQRSKRAAELLSKPGALPSVPTHDPSSGKNDKAAE
ncbi:VPS4-associated protein 1 [Lipomyces tetrasporus]|uniref:VPS4-associated protein 1 n=1 Tax=Lipomyces tetrasporus TaxID=54092 RepID=A0AAD7QQS0_9ASCO|nr:VPS4-associated protein 1 [Lipomyces tetrasporus]KAJ8099276.1 VPS4-associated protein 1 [Lipomyces tetrasporus]